MKTVEITGSLRNDLGKKTSATLRKEGLVPAVLYGAGENIHFAIDAKASKEYIYTPYVYLVKISIDGKVHNTIVKDLQFHPVNDAVQHIDFYEVSDKPVTISLPVKITGNSVGVRKGGKLRLVKRTLKVKGLIENMPEELNIDITNLDVAQSIKVEDLSYDKLQLCDNGKTPVISVMASRATQKAK